MSANIVVGLTWVGGIAACVWLATQDHPVVAVIVLLSALSVGVSRTS